MTTLGDIAIGFVLGVLAVHYFGHPPCEVRWMERGVVEWSQ